MLPGCLADEFSESHPCAEFSGISDLLGYFQRLARAGQCGAGRALEASRNPIATAQLGNAATHGFAQRLAACGNRKAADRDAQSFYCSIDHDARVLLWCLLRWPDRYFAGLGSRISAGRTRAIGHFHAAHGVAKARLFRLVGRPCDGGCLHVLHRDAGPNQGGPSLVEPSPWPNNPCWRGSAGLYDIHVASAPQ